MCCVIAEEPSWSHSRLSEPWSWVSTTVARFVAWVALLWPPKSQYSSAAQFRDLTSAPLPLRRRARRKVTKARQGARWAPTTIYRIGTCAARLPAAPSAPRDRQDRGRQSCFSSAACLRRTHSVTSTPSWISTQIPKTNLKKCSGGNDSPIFTIVSLRSPSRSRRAGGGEGGKLAATLV